MRKWTCGHRGGIRGPTFTDLDVKKDPLGLSMYNKIILSCPILSNHGHIMADKVLRRTKATWARVSYISVVILRHVVLSKNDKVLDS